MTARCGERRAWHWAHVAKRDCDSWWEETEWHRLWKAKFPIAWQEIILTDPQSGEKHIADVRTAHGLVLELQHSPLDANERTKREAFYGSMIWIVDVGHRKLDQKRFVKGLAQFRQAQNGVYLVPFPEECFPVNWVRCAKPVLFDFKGLGPLDAPDARELLWCLLPGRLENCAVVVAMNRADIVAEATNHSDLIEVLQKGHVIASNFIYIARQEAQLRQPVGSRRNYGTRRRRRF